MFIIKIKIPKIKFTIECSKGTYIRSIAHDFGKSLNNGAHLSKLIRTKIGEFDLKDAKSIIEFENELNQQKIATNIIFCYFGKERFCQTSTKSCQTSFPPNLMLRDVHFFVWNKHSTELAWKRATLSKKKNCFTRLQLTFICAQLLHVAYGVLFLDDKWLGHTNSFCLSRSQPKPSMNTSIFWKTNSRNAPLVVERVGALRDSDPQPQSYSFPWFAMVSRRLVIPSLKVIASHGFP